MLQKKTAMQFYTLMHTNGGCVYILYAHWTSMAAWPSIGEFSRAKHPYLCWPKMCHLLSHLLIAAPFNRTVPLQSTWGLGPKKWHAKRSLLILVIWNSLPWHPSNLVSVPASGGNRRIDWMYFKFRGSPPKSSRNVEHLESWQRMSLDVNKTSTFLQS